MPRNWGSGIWEKKDKRQLKQREQEREEQKQNKNKKCKGHNVNIIYGIDEKKCSQKKLLALWRKSMGEQDYRKV